MFKFSVLMSVYEKENPTFLKEAIESVTINQTIKPNELVLIEDGPLTDELYTVIDYLKSKINYLKVYSLKQNNGLGAALKYGVDKCQYDWIARMDSDDISIPTRFETQIKYLINNPKIDVLGSNITEFGNDASDLKSTKKMPTVHDDIKKMLKRRTPVCHVTVFIRKDSLQKSGNYMDLPYVEDYYLWARMMANNFRFYSIDKSLVLVRVGNGMVARRGNKSQIKSWKILNNYMLKNNLINRLDKIVNMILIRVFVYMPVKLKELIYTNVLRKKI